MSSARQKPKTINEIEVLDVKHERFGAGSPNSMIILENRVIIDRNWLEVVEQLTKAGYVDSTRNRQISSVTSFIQAAVDEKLERMFADYEGLGKIFAAQLQQQFGLCHSRIEGVNDSSFTEKGFEVPLHRTR